MSALLLSPHNDDETLWASFLCLRYCPHVIVCLRSAVQDSPRYPGGPISAETREAETAAAMEVLGCTWEQWAAPDDGPDSRALLISLTYYEEDHAPEIVLAPAIEDEGHEQHNLIGELAFEVFGDRVRPYLTYTRHGGRSRGAEVEFEPEWVALKYRALACYESQIRCPATRAHFVDEPIREYVL